MATDVDFIGALGAGSGINIRQLATNLVEVEKQPRFETIQSRIDTQDRRVAGYAAVSLTLKNLKDAFAKLNDAREFTSGQVSSTRPQDFTTTVTGSVQAGTHSVVVNQLAAAQKSVSQGFASNSTSINGGAALTLTFTIGGVAQSGIAVDAADTTPAGIVAAINDAGQGVTASLVDTGDPATPTRIVLTGASGASNSFSVAVTDDAGGGAVADLDFSTTLQASADASLVVDGLTVTRPSNAVADVIDGVTLNLTAVTAAGESGGLEVARDTTTVKENLTALVAAYNQTITDFDTLTGPASDDPEDIYSGSLARDSLIGTLRDNIRAMMMDDSSTPGASLTAFRDVGLDIDRYGVMSLNETTLDAALAGNFDEVVTLFSADTDDQTTFGAAARGIAGDAVHELDAFLNNRGLIAQQSANATELAQGYEDDLRTLEIRMEALYERYLRQFSAMESIVGESNSMRDSLKSTFDGMMAAYTNN
jgi:flagellar hook-associated protein 2